MVKAYGIDKASPAGNSDRREGDDAIRNNMDALGLTLIKDHYLGTDGGLGAGYNDDDAGEHAKVTLRTYGAGTRPAGVADKGILYTKDVSDIAELFFVDENDAAIQITNNGRVNAMPAGIVVPFAGADAELPAGWLLCDGTAYNGTTSPEYADLFAAIKNVYGGTTIADFQVPNYDGYFLRGTGGNAAALGVAQGHQMQYHRHSYENGDSGRAGEPHTGGYGGYINYANTGYQGGTDGGSENRPVNKSVTYIIKY